MKIRYFAVAAVAALVLGAVGGGALAWLKLREGGAIPEGPVIPEEQQIEFQQSPLVLYGGKRDFLAGEPGTLELKVFCNGEITEPVEIVDGQGQVVCSLENDGSGVLEAQVTINQTEPGVGKMTARSQGEESSPISYYVTPQITGEMVEELAAVSQDMGEYLQDADYEDPYSPEALEDLTHWLEKDGRVAQVEENDGILLFETQNHLMGSYGMGRRSPNTFGFSSPERAFENYQGEMPLDGIYLESQIPITNTKMIHLSPIPDNETVTRFSPFFRDSLERIEEEADFSLSWLDGEEALNRIASGDFTDCGFLSLNTHGSTISRKNGGRLLFFEVGEHKGEVPVELLEETGLGADQFQGFWGSITEAEDTYRLTLDLIYEDGEYNYAVMLSTNYLECVLGNKTFDNTVVYVIVCQAMSDQAFVRLLREHGASVVIGCKDNFDVGLSIAVLEKLSQVMTQVKENGDWGSILDAMSQSFGREIEEMVRQEVYPRSDEDPEDKDYQDYLLACQERLPVVYYGTNCEKRVFAGEGGFEGMVTDREERAIAEAKVTVYQWLNHDFKKVWSGETDEEGHYQAEEIPYGALAVAAEKDGAEGFVTTVLDEKAAGSLKDIVLEGDPYYPYIRDVLLPQMGYASLSSASRRIDTSQNIWQEAVGWDKRSGLLGADIADLDGDGQEDMLVYYFAPCARDSRYSGLYADLYTLSEEGKVVLVNSVALIESLSGMNAHLIYGGLMEVQGRTCLYLENNSNAYFADGSGVMYSWYGYVDGALRPIWKAGKTDGGSSDIAYGLLTYNGTDQYDKIYLWADSFVQAMNPGIQTLSQRNGLYGLLEGFKIIGLGEPAAAYYEFMEYTLDPDSPYIFPSYWGKDELKKSFQYRCTGVGNYSARDMTVTLSDETALKEHIEALER